MASRKRFNFRRVASIFLVAAFVLLLVPPVQVALAVFRDPPIVPMRLQRKVEAWMSGKRFEEAPFRRVALKNIPEEFIHFVWASEDQTFFKHRGFDIPRIRQAIDEARDRERETRAVSTITMQCARSLFLWQQRSYLRKALEAYYTIWMELFMSKKRILELYLNNVEFGPGIYGIGTAAEEYFATTPDRLTRSQMLGLAAILPNPLRWSPVRPNGAVLRKIRRVERLSSRAPFPSEELSGR
ncbi:MAG TPA: monofunctional biosynthetic peptidoglycan transglycosylase [Terrimicrobiaceae bacterium]